MITVPLLRQIVHAEEATRNLVEIVKRNNLEIDPEPLKKRWFDCDVKELLPTPTMNADNKWKQLDSFAYFNYFVSLMISIKIICIWIRKNDLKKKIIVVRVLQDFHRFLGYFTCGLF